jgi:hypothetical protein
LLWGDKLSPELFDCISDFSAAAASSLFSGGSNFLNNALTEMMQLAIRIQHFTLIHFNQCTTYCPYISFSGKCTYSSE